MGEKGQKGETGPDTEAAIEFSTLSGVLTIFMSGVALVFSSATLVWTMYCKSDE